VNQEAAWGGTMRSVHFTTLFFVKWKLIFVALFFILLPLLGSNLNMLCSNVNKTVVRIMNTDDSFHQLEFLAINCGGSFKKVRPVFN
jgi:hypothetical protein